MSEPREVLTWELFGTASRELAGQVAADGYRPDIIFSVARGGLFVAGALGYALDVKNLHVRCAVVYEKPRSEVRCEYVWRRTDRWINFPWSTLPPVVARDGQVRDA